MRAFVISILAATGAATVVCAQSPTDSSRIEQPRPLQQPALADPDAAAPRHSNWVDESAQPAGAALPGASSDPTISPGAPEIRQYLARLTDAALSGALPEAAEMLCGSDRERLKTQMSRLDLAAHNRLVELFRQQWKTRYGEEFALTQQRAVVADYFVMRGERSPEEAIIASDQRPGNVGNGQLAAPVKNDPEEDRAATLVVPPSDKSHPAMILMLANEGAGDNNWRLNTPDSLSARKLQQNLDARLKRFLDGQSSWPADEREAYRLITYHVLATFNDQPVDRPQPEPQRPTPENPSLES